MYVKIRTCENHTVSMLYLSIDQRSSRIVAVSHYYGKKKNQRERNSNVSDNFTTIYCGEILEIVCDLDEICRR